MISGRSQLCGALGVILLAASGSAAALHAQPRPVGRQTATVSGTVTDSVAVRVLSGATVQLVRQDSVVGGARTVESDALGQFRFTEVPPGRYLLGFLHPVLDDLGLEPTPLPVVVNGGRIDRADLAIPSPATLRIALCGERAVRDSIALVIGHTRRALDRAPLDSVVLTIRSRHRTRDAGPANAQWQQRRVAVSSTGWFMVCGLQSGDTIQLGASRNGVVASNQTLAIPSSGLLQHDVLVRDATSLTVTAAASSRDSITRAPRASAMLAVNGVVVAADGGRPISGAIVRVSGGAVTRSDARGAWRLVGVEEGTQTLTVRSVRYAPLSMTISVAPQMAPVQLSMVRLPGLLDTVTVVDDAVTDRNLADFLERRRTRGSGRFLSQDDITSRRPTLISDLLPGLQSGLTIERDTLGYKFITMPSNTFRSNRCLPAIFVDGMSMRRITTQEIDALVRPGELFGIEVYRAANAPVEFSEQDGCGTILFWTKR